MRYLITGGSGYIGSRFMERLAQRDDVTEIVNVDVKPPPHDIPGVTTIQRSVTEDLRDLFTKAPVAVALHLAWTVDPLHDSTRQRDICIGGTTRFLEGCAAGGVSHVFFMSSATAYGAHPDHAVPQRSDDPLLPNYHFQYSAEKREAEGLCRRYLEEHPDTLLQIGRPSIVGGPNVSNYIFRLMEKPLNFRAAGHDPELQFVHEDDAAEALDAIVRSRLPGAFNITADGAVRVSEAARLMGARMVSLPLPVLRAISGAAWRLHLHGLSEAPADFVYFATYPWLVDSHRLKDELGFQFNYDAQQILQAFVDSRTGSAG